MSDQTAVKRLNIGLLAHVDAGKTTLSEALLYVSGQIRKAGRVDHGDAFLDTDIQERERGITIFSKQAELVWKDLHLTLLDTPGHVDFSSEMERTLRIMDAAILLISGPDGVQGHTETLWRLLKAYQVPTLLFINKMDQPGTNRSALMKELKARLGDGCVDLASPEALEEAAMGSEEAMEVFLREGTLSPDLLAELVSSRALFPCFFGSALRMKGIEALLDGVANLVPIPVYPEDFGARVYKITHDPQGARLTWMKITGGSLRVKSSLPDGEGMARVNQIRLYSGVRFRQAEEVFAGQVCAVTGLASSRAGQGLGRESAAEDPLLTPVFSCRVLLPPGTDPGLALRNLRILEEEDPQLQVLWVPEKREIHVQLMGEVQLEILRRLLQDRFQLSVAFSEGGILYRETIAAPVHGVGHYEPLRHYAEVHLLLEPGERGSGLRLASACSVDQLELNWQRLIMTHLMEKTHRGVLTGSPITDMKITLLAGRAHLKHTEGGDFRQATYRAVRHGLMQARSVLLEPWYDFSLELPPDCVGRAMTDISQRGGSLNPPESHETHTLLTGSAPVASMRGYAREVAGYTRGQGRLTCVLKGYAPCRNSEEVIAARGYDPERDVENTADSVFCAHGAGFVVPWREVANYMHLHPDAPADNSPASSSEQASAPSSRAAYRGTLEEDKALQAIFERTYGKQKNRIEAAEAHRARPTLNGMTLELEPPKTEYLLVDGYNIIFAWPDLQELARHSLEDARKSLIDILSNFHGFHAGELILVFDAYRVQGSPGVQEEIQDIHVVYTKEAETADNYIEKTIREIARKRDSRVRVATSDALEQVIILGGGAIRVSAREFRQEVEQTRVQIAEILARNNLHPKDRSPVAQALQAAMRHQAEKDGKG
ncbi:MAG: TetM/TetW/TetO/TetS family tetracycline resistance ribosomal protection protein [Clostridia bacterium]|nr:TetM/TetW/TetO/TetS family tetracycline resistance ribosomal protection protein [Clostridia bacterium]